MLSRQRRLPFKQQPIPKTAMQSRHRSPSQAIVLDADALSPPPVDLIAATMPQSGPAPGHFDAAFDPLSYFSSGHAHGHPAAHHYQQQPHYHSHRSPQSSPSGRFAPYQPINGLHRSAAAAAALGESLRAGDDLTHLHPRRRRPVSGGSGSAASLSALHDAHDYLNPHYYAYGAPGGSATGLPYPPIGTNLAPYPTATINGDCAPQANPYHLDNGPFTMQYPPTAAPSAASLCTNESTFDEYNAPFHPAKSPLNPPALRSNPLAGFLGPIPHPHRRTSYAGDFTAIERPPTPPHFKSARHRPRPHHASNGLNESMGPSNGVETGSFTSNSSSSASQDSNRSSGHDRLRRHSYPAVTVNPTASTYSAPGQHASTDAAAVTDHRFARHHPGTSGPETTANGHNTAPVALLSVTCPQLAYITNVHGDVISIEGNGSVWDAYVENGIVHPFMDASPLACYPLILGRNLFDFIVCGKMQALLKHMLIISSNAQRSRLNYHWYSETDAVERKLRITLTRLSALMSNTSTSSTIRIAPRAFSSATAAVAAPPLPVVFSWTVTILSERVKSTTERSCASHLTSPPLPIATPHSRAMCLLCKRIQVDRHEISQDAWLDFAGPKRVVSDTNPVYESDGYTPILGYRGRSGMQIASAVQAGLTVWLTGAQVSAFNTSNAVGVDAGTSFAGLPSAVATVETAGTGPGGGPSSASRSLANGNRQSRPQSQLCVVPVHVGVCEVCRLDVLQFFSPMYTPIAGPVDTAAA